MSGFRNILEYHRSMMMDEVRTESFRRAIFEKVRPGDVVVDIGTGTGILALFACQAGASKVYAIEEGDIIHLARKICSDNGFADQVVFLNKRSTEVDLPVQADVLITETIGNFGIDEGILSWVIDARKRLLKANASIIPQEVTPFLAVIEDPELYQNAGGWANNNYGIDFSSFRAFSANNVYLKKLDEARFLSNGTPLGSLRLDSIDRDNFNWTVSCEIIRDGVLGGIGGWFKSSLTESIQITNEIPNTTPNWIQIFFPVTQALKVVKGDLVKIYIACKNEGQHWDWDVELQRGSTGETYAEKHSTFFGEPSVFSSLKKLSAGFTPEISSDGELTRTVLELMDKGRTNSDIAKLLHKRFPDQLDSMEKALLLVGKLSRKFSQ